MTQSKKHQKLRELAAGAIERLRALPPPVVRVCGPLTSGGFGYEENKRTFLVAETVLKEKGYTVFDYFDGNDDEDYIAGMGLPWLEVMEYYHKPILESGLITTAFFLPHWRESNGATWEHEFIAHIPLMKIRSFPAQWLEG
jgi:Domain of unknown function (DUF4406)